MMPSAAPWLAGICFFTIWTSGVCVSPERLYNITQLTFSGDHSFPRFSADGRYIYFSAKGGPYGTKKCDDIYKLDLKYYNVNEDNWRISRVSTGLGHATRVSMSTDGKDSLIYESSFEQVFNNPSDDTIGSFCPPSACKPPNDKTAPCGTNATIEHFVDTNIYFTNSRGSPKERLSGRSQTTFKASVDQLGDWVINTESCQRVIGTPPTKVDSTCLRLTNRAKKIDSVIFPTAAGPASYVDYARFGPDTTNIKIFYTARALTATETKSSTVFAAGKTELRSGTVDINTGAFTPDTTVFSDHNADSDTDAARLYARPYMNGLQSYVTLIEKNGKSCIYDIEQAGKSPTPKTSCDYNSMMPDIDAGQKQMVFVRQPPGETDYQIYVGFIIGKEDKLFPDFKNITSVDDNNELDYLTVDQHIELEGRVGRARLSELYSDLFFEWTGDKDSVCQQVYHIDTGPNDYSTFRRLSTGIGRTAGMDYFISINGTTGQMGKKVIYSSNFMRKQTNFTNVDVSGCELVGCEKGSDARNKSAELDQFCANAKHTRYLGNEFDLYQTNMFGNIERRLTNNSFFNGEPSISLNNRLVYSQVGDSRVDLVVHWLDHKNPKTKVITSIMPVGYYGSASFSPDAKWVVFHGSQAGKDVYLFKKFLDTYQVVDTTVSEIFLINVYNRTYRQLTSAGLHNQNPTFTPDAHVIFEQTSDDGKHSLWQVDLHGNELTQLTNEDDYKARYLSFARNHPNATVFVGNFKNDTVNVWTNRIYFAEYKPKMRSITSTTQTSSTSSTTSTTTQSTTTVTVPTMSTSTDVGSSSETWVRITGGDDDGGGAGQTGVGLIPTLLMGYWLLRNGF